MATSDLNVPCGDVESVSDVLSTLSKFGYKKLALNHTVDKLNKADTTEFIEKFNKLKQQFDQSNKDSQLIQPTDHSQTLFSRLTLNLTGKKDDSGNVFSSNSPLLAMYDILAVAPSDFQTLQTACALEVDIIVIPPGSYTSYIRHAVVKSAIDRGVHFEISIGPYLRNPDLRNNFFACGSAIINSTGGKNILLTNGAEKAMEVRAANDLANLATLLGLDFGIAKKSLSHAPASILLRSQTRKTAKGVLRVTDVANVTNVTDVTDNTEKEPSRDTKLSQLGKRPSAALPDFIPFSDEPEEISNDKNKNKNDNNNNKNKDNNHEGDKRKGKRKAGAQS